VKNGKIGIDFKMKRKHFFKFMLYFLVGIFYCVTGIIAIELSVRIFIDYPISGISYHPNEGWRFKKNCYEKERFIGLTQENIMFSTNKHGFRDCNHTILKDKESKRIMFLGDSYTAGVYISNDEIFTSLFQNKLHNKFTKQKYDVMNVAVPAWGTDQQFLYFINEGQKYHPDYVFMMISHSDIRESFVKRFLYLSKDNVLKDAKNRSIPLSTHFYWFLSNHFQSFRLLQKIMNIFSGDFKDILHRFPDSWESDDYILYDREPLPMVQEALALFQKIILEMNKLCEKNNSQLVLVVIPTKMEFDGELQENGSQPGKVASYVQGIAIKHNILFLDLYSLLTKKEHPLEMFISNEYHYTRAGHQFIADGLFNYFISNIDARN
jgi:lysophospholipase L1-like esterase